MGQLLEREMIQHIEQEDLRLVTFKSGKKEAVLGYELILSKDETYKITFDIEEIEETLVVEFNGGELPENIRLLGSELLERIVKSIRFKHKEKEWSLSRYYVWDSEAYSERVNPEYPEKRKEEWVKLFKKIERDTIQDYEILLLELEEVHDISLRIAGLDGYYLVEYLQKIGVLSYEKIHENEYDLQLKKPKHFSERDGWEMKILLSKELMKYGYNVWVDYEE
jgi:hypothetical protein